jgi:hypothetical protein
MEPAQVADHQLFRMPAFLAEPDLVQKLLVYAKSLMAVLDFSSCCEGRDEFCTIRYSRNEECNCRFHIIVHMTSLRFSGSFGNSSFWHHHEPQVRFIELVQVHRSEDIERYMKRDFSTSNLFKSCCTVGFSHQELDSFLFKNSFTEDYLLQNARQEILFKGEEVLREILPHADLDWIVDYPEIRLESCGVCSPSFAVFHLFAHE